MKNPYIDVKQKLLEPERNKDGTQFKHRPNKSQRILEAVNNNKILDEFPNSMDCKPDFRKRDKTKEINQSMRYRSTTNIEQI